VLVLEHVQVVQAVRFRVRSTRIRGAFQKLVVVRRVALLRLAAFFVVAIRRALGFSVRVPETEARGALGDPVHVHVVPGEGDVQHHGHRTARARVRVAVEGFLPRLVRPRAVRSLALEIESALVVEHRRLAAVHGERDAHRVVRHRERDDTWRSIRDVVRE
jgi:hypothetical protein